MIIVISVGGSLIVPDKIDVGFLTRFCKLIKNYSKRNKIVLVTGGGHTARKYINVLRSKNIDEPFVSLVGIESTKINAAIVAGFLKRFHLIPDSLKEVKDNLKKSNIVVCGALGFQPKLTSDGDAAEIAEYLKADIFVNLTNVDGLYSRNPLVYKDAKFIPCITFRDFLLRVNKIKFKAGQHFVLDQFAARVISRCKIKTVIMNGKKLKNFENFLKRKKFKGTVIYG